MSDLDHCPVEEVPPNGSRAVFHISGYSRSPYQGQDMFRGEGQLPVEGAVKNADGADIGTTIYSNQNHRLLELELLKPVINSIFASDQHGFKLK